ncbi:IS200/IS605 family transposase [Flammeovirga yaeyamensis]|uniref:IS200/IS605 family transposase n=1 Tax=Flammeovirga yaeyamensis TaxID=367791 RepID=A0AAX1MZP5_9BACT|nr:IS200/IS605 family transposase [Flammeovirga yaeyamensis]MBB3700945.1 putative transposase [Flammeovirga yaeyamensis]NMF38052.1 IS200/IS605 family transposase [Flammeovirga yaeyamensis]QWG00702.1 IS200/IS605 family transposase [Flammeovirga yaeyamensis]
MTRSKAELWVHMVWNTKNFEVHFTQVMWKDYLNDLFFSISEQYAIDLHQVNGYNNHVHALIRLRTGQNVEDIARVLKSISCSRIKSDLKIRKFSWQEGYYVCSVSPDRVVNVRGYIQRQWVKHERVVKYKEEVLVIFGEHL